MTQTLHNLPPIDINPFIQRHGVIQSLKESFHRASDSSRSVITILHGIGGQGKTQIVLSLCQSSWARTQFHNVFWIDSASRETTEASFSSIASEISSLRKSEKDTISRFTGDTFRSSVKQWPTTWLFVFDNYDSDGEHFLQEFIPQSRYAPSHVASNSHLTH